MFVNGRPISWYGGELQYDYSVTGAELDTSYTSTGQFPLLLQQKAGLKTISLPITFHGKDSKEAYMRYSLFCQDASGTPELTLPDGFLYTAIMTGISAEKYITEGSMDVTFTFAGIRHGPYQKVTGNRLICMSTLPKTDCILTVTVKKTQTNYKVGSVTFPNVTAGEKLCVDGITKRILVGGVPAAQRAEWLEFPYLVPGINNITCPDTVTVEYYPAYF